MARQSEAQRIEAANEAAALVYFDEAMAALPDPRRRQGQRYPLRSIIVIALMAMVCSCDDAEAMELWAEANEDWLGTFLELPHGVPTQDVFLSVLGSLEPKAFSRVYQRWADLVSLRLGEGNRHIAIDGKTSRRSGSPTNGHAPIHTVSADLREAGVVLAQTQVREKSNEITAIPELLAVLDLRHATVTSDAMGCQTAVVESIVKAGGDYLICAKGNQPTLEEEIKETFREANDPRRRAVDEAPRPEVTVHEETEKGHGRIEQRTVRVTSRLDWVQSSDRWAGLGYLVEVRRERTVIATGKTSIETSHYIGSGTPPSAQQTASLIRGHWSIENGLHWVLDVAFHEDHARHRAKNAAANMTTLRHFALALVQNDPTRKLGVANTRKKAAFMRDYLISLFASFAG